MTTTIRDRSLGIIMGKSILSTAAATKEANTVLRFIRKGTAKEMAGDEPLECNSKVAKTRLSEQAKKNPAG